MAERPQELQVIAFVDGTPLSEIARELRRLIDMGSIRTPNLALVDNVSGPSTLIALADFDDFRAESRAISANEPL